MNFRERNIPSHDNTNRKVLCLNRFHHFWVSIDSFKFVPLCRIPLASQSISNHSPYFQLTYISWAWVLTSTPSKHKVFVMERGCTPRERAQGHTFSKRWLWSHKPTGPAALGRPIQMATSGLQAQDTPLQNFLMEWSGSATLVIWTMGASSPGALPCRNGCFPSSWPLPDSDHGGGGVSGCYPCTFSDYYFSCLHWIIPVVNIWSWPICVKFPQMSIEHLWAFGGELGREMQPILHGHWGRSPATTSISCFLGRRRSLRKDCFLDVIEGAN